MDDFPIVIRETVTDHVIFSIVCSGVLLLWLLLVVYLVVQRIRNVREKSRTAKSKADRPLYITGLVVAASFFIAGTLFTTGHVRMNDPVSYLPATMIYFVQYLFGALMWLWLTIDRILQRYVQVRFAGVEKHRKGLVMRFICFLIAFVPFLALSIVAVSLDKVDVNVFGVTDQDDTFEILMVVYLGVYFLSICFLTFKIRRIIGNFHELIRYTTFIFTTMLFFVYDAMTTLWHDLQTELVAQNVLMMVVWTIVMMNMIWIFVLALRPRKPAKDIETGEGEDSVLKKAAGDREAINNFIDLESTGARQASTDSLSSSHYSKNILWFRLPRRRLAEETKPDFIEFVSQLPKPVGEQLDKESGYFSQTSGIQRSFEFRSPRPMMEKLKS